MTKRLIIALMAAATIACFTSCETVGKGVSGSIGIVHNAV